MKEIIEKDQNDLEYNNTKIDYSIVIVLARDYRDIKFKEKNIYYYCKNGSLLKPEKQFCDYIDSLILRLDEDSKLILKTEYFYSADQTKPDNYWYLNYYAKSTYFLKKKIALNEIARMLKA